MMVLQWNGMKAKRHFFQKYVKPLFYSINGSVLLITNLVLATVHTFKIGHAH